MVIQNYYHVQRLASIINHFLVSYWINMTSTIKQTAHLGQRLSDRLCLGLSRKLGIRVGILGKNTKLAAVYS
jgi:hypothetical protein